jgi:integrase
VSLWAASDKPEVAAVVADLRARFTEAAMRDLKLPIGLTDARPYDLRHTFASVGAGGGLSLAIIGKLLGHSQARTTQRYAHLADEDREGQAAP